MMQQMRRFSRYWDLIANSGNFLATLPMLWKSQPSRFNAFMSLSQWLFQRLARHHGIALNLLSEALFECLCGQLQMDRAEVAQVMALDYQANRRELPEFLRPYVKHDESKQPPRSGARLPPRQMRHAM
jgi:hypothetical protein